MMTRLDWLVLAACVCAIWKLFLWVVYRLCPSTGLPARLNDEPAITLDNVLGIWLRECRGHIWRIRQHEHPSWGVYREWALERAWVAIAKHDAERTERLARYLEKVPDYEAPKAAPDNVTSIGGRAVGAKGH